MQSIDSHIEVSPTIGKTISRIYQGMRFSKDKSRFRNRMCLTFRQDKKYWIDYPVYFFEIRPDSFYYGLGYYSATQATMLFVARMSFEMQRLIFYQYLNW
ncbi:DUF2461 family protein [Escherichia coli]|nr:DUF2461 family protein [Escherichia coli]